MITQLPRRLASMHRTLLSALVTMLALGQSALAEDKCPISVLPVRSAKNIFLIEKENGRCRVLQVVVPNYECNMYIANHHGDGGFGCGGDFYGKWGFGYRAEADPSKGLLASSGWPRHLPKHLRERRTWLAPVDGESLDPYNNNNEVRKNYPRRFTEITPITRLDNPNFEIRAQTIKYISMSGERHGVVTGEAAYGCQRLYFIITRESGRIEETSKDMISFLQGLRLEPVQKTDEDRICAIPNL